MSRRVAAVVAGGIVAAVHVPLWPTAFYFDDHVHLVLAAELSFREAVSTGLFATYYRPVGLVLWWLLARLPGLSPLVAHVLVAAVIAATLWTIVAVLRRLGIERRVAVAAGVAGALLPTTVVTAAWVSNLYGSVSALAGFGAVLAALDPRPRVAWLAPALLVAACAAKEDGVLYLLAVAVVGLSRIRDRRRPALLGSCLLAVAAYGGVRWLVLGGAGLPLRPDAVSLVSAVVIGVVGVACCTLLVVLRSVPLRIGLVLLVTGTIAGLVGWRTVFPDTQHPDIRWRFFYGAGLAAVVLAAVIADRATSWRGGLRAAGVGVAALAALTVVTVDAFAVVGWRSRTASSAMLVERVVGAVRRDPGARLVVVRSGPPEVALGSAVRLREKRFAGVVVRPGRATLMVVPPGLESLVRNRTLPIPLKGNPARVGTDLVLLAFAPDQLWRRDDPALGEALFVVAEGGPVR